MRNISGLTGLRFLAAFYVFVFHVNLRTPLPLNKYVLHVISQGAVGVAVFFVLSGFILTYTYLDKSISYQNFIIKRLGRIYPVCLVGLITCLIVSICFGDIPSPSIILLNLLMLESWVPNLSMKWYGAGAWSISTEFFFYLMFPFLLSFLKSVRSPKKVFLYLILFCFISAIPGIIFNLTLLFKHPINVKLVYTFPPSRIFEFICGMLAALLSFKFELKIKNRLAAASILFTGLYFSVIGYRAGGYVVNNIFVVPTTILVMLVLVQRKQSILFKWIGSPIMEYLGKISYAFYIMQIPIMLATEMTIKKGIVITSPTLFFFLALTLNLIIASLVYHFVESPIHIFVNQRLKARKAHKPIPIAA